ncbi:hypothetical protein CK203_060953 [Vitis vinifera]|uniref:Reverse transcriptase/retrotransposon-derived protein RNase H-like domain-containing protein n=1 Tax=Vitis vinifera TaxID=29760 RepID=A0A438G9E3_VITVI|nr:hypothetical protein CK203_060953 [Vitis vinifera]
MATPSQSRSSGKGEEDHSEWHRAIKEDSWQSERQLQALLQETKNLREENAVLRIQASSNGASPSPAFERPDGKLKAGTRVNYTLDSKSHPRNQQRPQEPRSKATAAIAWEAHPDPMVTPIVQNVLPHRDPMVTLMVQNVQPHLADLSEAFVGQYLCSARHKQNISHSAKHKNADNESLREFVKRFDQVVLQASRSGADRNAKLPNQPRPSNRRQEGPRSPGKDRPSHPLSISYEKLLPMIQAMSDFRWPKPSERTHPKRDHSKKCAFHKEHGHTTEECRCLHYLVEKLIRAGHLKQYLRSDAGGRNASQTTTLEPLGPATPKVVINYINGGPSDEEYDSKRKRQKLLQAASVRERYQLHPAWDNWRGTLPHRWDNQFFSTSRPHPDIASAPRRPHPVPRDRRLRREAHPSRPRQLNRSVQASVISHMGHSLTGLKNPRRILSGFNGSSTTSLGDIVLPIQAGPVTLNVQFSVVQDLSTFNIILGRTWLHYMKVIPSTYHQMVSFLTKDGKINLYGSQLVARQCYQIAREAGTSQEDASLPKSSMHVTNSNYWVRRTKILRQRIPCKQSKFWKKNEIDKLLEAGFIKEVDYPDWLANVVVVPKKEGKWRGMLSFLDAFSGYHQIPMSPADEEKTSFITPHGLYCYTSHVIRTQKRWRHLLETHDKDLQTSCGIETAHSRAVKALLEKIKHCLMQPPILSSPLPEEKLYMYLVVSEWAISATLFRCPSPKEQKPIYYVSRALADVETKYSKWS